jgi:DNA polymerase III delta prime subunit
LRWIVNYNNFDTIFKSIYEHSENDLRKAITILQRVSYISIINKCYLTEELINDTILVIPKEIINKLIDEDIKRIKGDDILINHIIDDEELEEIFREKGVHFVEIIDQEDKNSFIDEMEKELKGEIIFYES